MIYVLAMFAIPRLTDAQLLRKDQQRVGAATRVSATDPSTLGLHNE